jgi:hypothetical protein
VEGGTFVEKGRAFFVGLDIAAIFQQFHKVGLLLPFILPRRRKEPLELLNLLQRAENKLASFRVDLVSLELPENASQHHRLFQAERVPFHESGVRVAEAVWVLLELETLGARNHRLNAFLLILDA